MKSSANPTRLKRSERWMIGGGKWLIRGFADFVNWSSQIDVIGWENMEQVYRSGRPGILAIWHGSLAAAMISRCSLQIPPLLNMSSLSRDGDIAVEMIKPFRIDAVRGSSSRGGAAGLRAMIDHLKLRDPVRGGGDQPRYIAVHSLDGPRGPRHEAKPGVIMLAKESDALILPTVFGMARRWVARRAWDRQRLPLPFGRIVVCFGKPISLSERPPDSGESPADSVIYAPNLTPEGLSRVLMTLGHADPLCDRDQSIP